MKALLKWALIGLGGLLAIAVVGGIAFAMLFDANALKNDLTALVKKETGRELAIDGDLELTFFPWLGFTLQSAALSNAPGFGDEPFATIETVSARARLMPLLSKRVEIGKLTLDGMHLNLIVANDGASNWADLAALGDEGEAAPPPEGGGSFQAQSIGGIEMSNTSLRYRDASSGADYQLSGGRIATGEVRPGQPFTIEVGAQIESTSEAGTLLGEFSVGGVMNRDADSGQWRWNEPAGKLEAGGTALPVEALEMTIAANMLSLEGGRIRVDYPKLGVTGSGSADGIETMTGTVRTDSLWLSDNNEISAPHPAVELSATGGSLPGGKLDLSLDARALSGSLDTERFSLQEFSGTVQGVAYKGELAVEKALSEPQVAGNLVVSPFSPSELMARMDVERPVTADPAVLGQASLSADFMASTTAASLENLALNLDDTTVRGSAGVADFASLAIRFDLAVDDINLDRYLAPAQEGGEQSGVAEDVAIPADAIRDLNLQGSLRVQSLKVAGLRSSNVQITVNAADGAVRVHPTSAELYGGTYSGDVALDASGEKPVLTMNESLTDVQFGPLSQDLFQQQNLSGTVSGAVKLRGTGNEVGEVRSTLNGDMRFSFVDGAYEGFNLWYEIARAVAVVKQEPAPAAPDANRTVFSNMSGTATVTDGILRNDDLAMRLPFIQVSGNGEVNLPDQSVDYQVNAEVIEGDGLDEVASANDLVGYEIPVRIAGPMVSPSVRPEVGPIVAQIIERKGREKVEELVEDKLGSEVSDLLGLGRSKDTEASKPAGTAAAPAEEAPAEEPPSIEDEIKRSLFNKLLGGDKDEDDDN
ncbi:MAG: AsmA family protein [Pseudomonadota bacterium]